MLGIVYHFLDIACREGATEAYFKLIIPTGFSCCIATVSHRQVQSHCIADAVVNA